MDLCPGDLAGYLWNNSNNQRTGDIPNYTEESGWNFYKELGVRMEDLPPETSIKSSEEVMKSAGIDFDHDKIDEIIILLLKERESQDPSE